MENKMTVFTNEEFGKIRTIIIENEPWFVGKDVAVALGYTNASKAVSIHVDDEDKLFIMLDIADSRNGNMPIGKTKTACINESGLYSLILSSKLESAKSFKRWITHEVLPSIRKHGGYIAGQESMSNEELLGKALLYLQSKYEEQGKALQEVHAELAEAVPKVQFYDAVTVSENSISVGDLAKLLNQNGVPIGQNKLFEWLRRKGYLMTRRSEYNLPTQKAMDMNLFEIHEHTFSYGAGTVKTGQTTKVTGVGQQYFINLFLHKRAKEDNLT